MLWQDAAVQLDSFGYIELLDEIKADAVHETRGEASIGDQSHACGDGTIIEGKGLKRDVGIAAEIAHVGSSCDRDTRDFGVHPVGDAA